MRHLHQSTTSLSLLIWASIVLFHSSANATNFSGRLPATSGGSDWLAYYDPHLNITWMAAGNGLGSGKQPDAVIWAAGLVIGGVSGWRLPSMDLDGNGIGDCSIEVSCRDNELEYQYKYNEIHTDTDHGFSPFNNITVTTYFSSTLNPPANDRAFQFSFDSGTQGSSGLCCDNAVAWAVHDGDVGIVPEPSTGLLMITGLVAISASRRRSLANRTLSECKPKPASAFNPAK